MDNNFPPEVAVSLRDLMRLEHHGFHATARHKVHAILAGQHASKLRGRGLDFAEVRQYVAGDDIRTIDWKVTARKGRTHSKVFNEEKERPGFVIVDQSAYMFFGSQRFTKSVIAAQAVALAAFHTIRSGDRFGGLVMGTDRTDHIVPRRSKATVENYLQCVVNANRQLPLRKKLTSNLPLLKETIHRATGLVTHDYVISIITDFSEADTALTDQLKTLSRHNDVILIHVADPLDEKLPSGKVMVSDGEHQFVWRNNRHDALQQYTSRFQEITQAFPRKMLHYNMPVVVLDTLKPAFDQISSILAKAAAR